ncbi:MAG: type II methionyl aminopeptidase [Chlamydiae bacterium]|nr:type II methionyl aminopeptidase [Chlamydiota bacterium]
MDQEYKKNFLEAGKIASAVRAHGKSLIIRGASYNEVIAKIRSEIKSLGAIPAFPPQIALDSVAAHYLPMPNKDIIFTSELVKLDVGICVNGAIGDCATSVDLSGKYQHIVDAAEEALAAATALVKAGITVSEIGSAIEKAILSKGLKPIRNLTGHGLGKFKVHTAPHFPNYNDNSKYTLKPGMTFAIEPFATNGAGWIYDAGNATIFSLLKSNKKYTGFVDEIYQVIKNIGQLPFCTHDLMSPNTPLDLVKKALKILIKDHVIADYAPLVDEKHGVVAQAENSFLIDEDGVVTVTTF